MAVITVTVGPPADIPSLVRSAFSAGLPVGGFRAAVESGQPVFAEELFGDRDFHEVADELEALVRMLRRAGVGFVIREAGSEIAPEVLTNLLAEGRVRFRNPQG